LSLGLTLVTILFPFYIMVVTSLSPDGSLYTVPPTVIPTELTLRHYEAVLGPETFPFVQQFQNSLIVAVTTATLSVIVGSLGAYSFARLEYPGRTILNHGVLIVYMFSGILLVVPLYQIIVWLDLIDNLGSLLITYLVQLLPLSLYMLRNYFRSIPPEIEEAALMEGYSRTEVIRKITLPLSTPAIIAVFTYAFIIAWNEYLFASIFLRSEDKFTLPIGIEFLTVSFNQSWGQIMAASVLVSIPVFVLFLYLEQYMIEGLTAGSVQG
ncbi:MAG: carbohydrate ABC transporter permease, partial [Halobacteriales archaeon]